MSSPTSLRLSQRRRAPRCWRRGRPTHRDRPTGFGRRNLGDCRASVLPAKHGATCRRRTRLLGPASSSGSPTGPPATVMPPSSSSTAPGPDSNHWERTSTWRGSRPLRRPSQASSPSGSARCYGSSPRAKTNREIAAGARDQRTHRVPSPPKHVHETGGDVAGGGDRLRLRAPPGLTRRRRGVNTRCAAARRWQILAMRDDRVSVPSEHDHDTCPAGRRHRHR